MLRRGATKLDENGKSMRDARWRFIYEPYRIKLLNTINFKKSMKYNPFAYIRSEKDILKLVNVIIANTKGDGEKSSEDFWIKAKRLLYCTLIGYIWYEAAPEEKNFLTLLELINASEVRENDVYGGRLPVHVRYLLDEFANIGQIPNFDKLIATIRSREISASIILQSQSQLKAIYKDAAEIISDNCDCTLFLSGRGKNAKEIAEVLGKETIDSYNQSENRGAQTSHGLNYQKLGKELMSQDEIATMDGGKCILQVRGVRPFFSEKYDITRHPRYQYLSDADKKNTFDVDSYLSSLRRKKRRVITEDEPFDLYDIELSEEDFSAE